jgi:hypothetical protein
MVGDESPPVFGNSGRFRGNETLQKNEENQSSKNPGVSRFEHAVEWLSSHLDDCPRPIIPYIKQAYALNNLEATDAIRLATARRAEGVLGGCAQ